MFSQKSLLWFSLLLILTMTTFAMILQISFDTRSLQNHYKWGVYFLPNNEDKVIEYKLTDPQSEVVGFKKASNPSKGFAFKTSEQAGNTKVYLVSSDKKQSLKL